MHTLRLVHVLAVADSAAMNSERRYLQHLDFISSDTWVFPHLWVVDFVQKAREDDKDLKDVRLYAAVKLQKSNRRAKDTLKADDVELEFKDWIWC